ncbi:MAG: sugar phosphate isomerase/epimerase family protein [Chloroflexota bacterium]
MSDQFTLSGFADEIAEPIEEQLDVLASLDVRHLDLRSASKVNVMDLDAAAIERIIGAARSRGVTVSMIGSPIGKSEITRDFNYEQHRLNRAIELARAFDVTSIRLFSFYHEGLTHTECRDEVMRRMAAFADTARAAGVTLLLENEAGLWGDTPEHVLDLLDTVGSPNLHLTFDTGNFASIGVASHDVAYPLLKHHLVHTQIKDVKQGQGPVVPGTGDGQIPQTLAALKRDGYRGYLSLEPHLALAGKTGGFSGPDLFAQATRALQRMVADLG